MKHYRALLYSLLLSTTTLAVAADSVNVNTESAGIEKENSDNIDRWIQQTGEWGTRKTGSKDHLECIEWLTGEFENLGLKVQREMHSYSYYDVLPENAHLIIEDENGKRDIRYSSIYPFSGFTDSNGVTSELVFIEEKNYSDAQGKIAVVEVPNKAVPADALFDIKMEFPQTEKVLPDAIYNPVLSSTLFGPKLEEFREAGAKGVVAVWKNMTPGMAAGQYLPFTFPYKDMPAMWVAGEDGQVLIEAAHASKKAHFKMSGSLESVDSVANIWTVIEGKKRDETILVITHTDGTNPVEDNGHIGLLSLAQQIVESGKKPERTIIFVAVGGHLRLPDITQEEKEQATTVWLNNHRELWDGKKENRKAVAGLVLEHLGAMEWDDRDDGYVKTGRPEIEVVYATTPKMQDIVKRNWEKRTTPFRSSVATPRSIRHLGEGEPLFEEKIPAIALLGIPSYLLTELQDDGPGITKADTPDMVNVDLLREQCTSAYSILQEMDTTDVSDFGRVKHVGFFGKIKDIAKVIKVIKADY